MKALIVEFSFMLVEDKSKITIPDIIFFVCDFIYILQILLTKKIVSKIHQKKKIIFSFLLHFVQWFSITVFLSLDYFTIFYSECINVTSDFKYTYCKTLQKNIRFRGNVYEDLIYRRSYSCF